MPLQLAPLHSHDPPFPLPSSGAVTIGRRPNNTLVCNDISVSGRHCEISISETLKISDCSTNGTYINDDRIVKGQVAELSVGDVIALTKPHPAGALDSTVEPALRVQFRLELVEGKGDTTSHQKCTAQRGGETPSFSQSCQPPKRASTTAEGFAHDLLMQEQQCKAKITGELLLARRRLDEERSKSESLSRDLRKAKANLEEERRRKACALEGREALKMEAAKLKDHRHQLPEMKSTQTSLQQKHEALEIELTAFAQKASGLETAVARLRDELGELRAAPPVTGPAKTLESAQEAFRQAHEEATSLEKEVQEAQQKAEAAQKEMEKLQQELHAERTRKERLEDQQALLASEVERAVKSSAQAEDLLEKAKQEIQSLEERVSRHRSEAEQQRQSSSELRRQQQLQLQSAEQMREACGRFAEALQGCTEKWLNTLPEGESMMPPPPPVVVAPAPPAVVEAAPAVQPGSEHKEPVKPPAELVESLASQEQNSQPSQPPPVPPPDTPPEGREAAPAAPQRLWSVAVLGGTAVEADSLGLLLDASPKRRKVSAH